MPWYFMLYSFKSKESFFPLEKRLMNNVLQDGEEHLGSILKYNRLSLLHCFPIIWHRGFLISQNNNVNNYML